MAKQFTDEDDALLAELGVEVETKKASARTPQEERVVAGFEEIQRFVEEKGRPPQHGEDKDIFERLYAVRLDRLRELLEFRPLLEPIDQGGLLGAGGPVAASIDDDINDDALLAELGVEVEKTDLAELRHVRSSAEKKAAEEIANRQKCEDFERFKPLFEQVQNELDSGLRETRPFKRDAEILPGQFFILGGQKAYVQGFGKEFETTEGRINRRMRVIFDNGTEISSLLRSFQRALYKPENHGRRITDPAAGPLFSSEASDGDEASGTIYVLRSKSDLPIVKEHREVLHKIGVTSGKVDRRIANAKIDATFLLADVEVVATYELYNTNRTKLENLIHRIFDPARLDIEIKDRFGNPVAPREWFLVPFAAIDEAVARIKDGSISNFRYDPKVAKLAPR
ncbi:MAG: GIY-YIG nuclease family protein [Parvularculaceae bacterium]